MDSRWYTVSRSSCAYIYCILTLLCGNGLTASYYDDRRGQPELQQAMDNAPLLPSRDLLPFPSGQHRDISFLLTEKTSALLSEALHMLQKIKDVRERKWLEAFILRLGSLATDLEEDNSVKTTNEEEESVVQPSEHAVPSSSSTAVARKLYEGQIKSQVTSAQVNNVLPVNGGNINREAVTKPGLVFHMNTDKNNDLVKQLHSQDIKMKSKSSLKFPVIYNSRLLDTTVTTQAVTEPTSSNGRTKPKHIVVHAQFEVKKHKKEPQKDVRNIFKQTNSQHITDFNNVGFVHGQMHSMLESVRGIDVGRNEGISDVASQERKETVNPTVFPTWKQVLETVYDGDSRAQLREPEKYFVPVEPTMSDEMERELRAGKIVVLSDSLVRTNFKPKHTNNRKGSVTQPASLQIPENDEIHFPSKVIRNKPNEDK